MMSGLVDFHVHLFPLDKMGGDLSEFARRQQEPFWGQLMVPEKGSSLQGWVTVREMLQKMDDAGIEKAVLQGWYWQQFETCQLHNRWMRDVLHEYPDRFEAFASIVPTADNRAVDELKWALENGFSGIGEMHPWVQGFSLMDEDWLRLMPVVQRQKWPILFHVTEPVGRSYEPRVETDFRELQQFIEGHQDIPVVLAHWGGLVFAHHLNPSIAKRWKHVYYDTAASPLLYQPEIVKLALQVLPADRVLYGSDYPLKLYPKDPAQPEFSRFLGELKAPIEKDDWLLISRKNAMGLLGR